MPKLTKSTRNDLINDLLNGMNKTDVQDKYKISKQAYYKLLKQQQPKQPDENILNQNLNNEIQQTNEQKEQIDNTDILYEPNAMFEYMQKDTQVQEAKPTKMPSISAKKINDVYKQIAKKDSKIAKQKDKELMNMAEIEPDKQEIIMKISKYIYAFKSNQHINDFISSQVKMTKGKGSIDSYDKQIESFVFGLYKKNSNELNNILKYIQFNIRTASKSSMAIENSLIFGCIIIEKIGSRVGFQFQGLTADVSKDLKDESTDLYKSLNEICIELDLARYFNNPKIDLLMNVSGKLMTCHQRNKLLNSMNGPSNVNLQSTNNLKQTHNIKLEEKYNDL